jgi:membrane protein implicated in regulation of membrane protease activity
MDEWIIWLIAAAVFGVAEIVNLSFYLLPFAIGAAVAAAVALVGGAGAPAFAVFAVATTLSFMVVRPIARRHLHSPPQIRTGAAALVGREATVLQRVDAAGTTGSVRLDGEVWSARAYDESSEIAAGTRVHVVEIRGAIALVSE